MALINDFQIATFADGVAGLIPLPYRGLPIPDSWTYQPYAVVRVKGTGAPAGYGFPVASWSWDALSQGQLHALLDFFTAGEASVQVYVTTRKYQGRKQGTGNFLCYMSLPVDGEGKTMTPDTRQPIYSSISVTLSHLEEQ